MYLLIYYISNYMFYMQFATHIFSLNPKHIQLRHPERFIQVPERSRELRGVYMFSLVRLGRVFVFPYTGVDRQ